jgi:hypothetical protein
LGYSPVGAGFSGECSGDREYLREGYASVIGEVLQDLGIPLGV